MNDNYDEVVNSNWSTGGDNTSCKYPLFELGFGDFASVGKIDKIEERKTIIRTIISGKGPYCVHIEKLVSFTTFFSLKKKDSSLSSLENQIISKYCDTIYWEEGMIWVILEFITAHSIPIYLSNEEWLLFCRYYIERLERGCTVNKIRIKLCSLFIEKYSYVHFFFIHWFKDESSIYYECWKKSWGVDRSILNIRSVRKKVS